MTNENILGYLQENFLTAEQLVDEADCTLEDLKRLQEAGVFAGPAYHIDNSVSVTSYFGAHEEVISADYYPPAYVEQLKERLATEKAGGDVLADARADFEATFRQLLVDHRAAEHGLEALFTDSGEIDEAALKTNLDKEWQNYLDGTYGLCTRCGTPEHIALKSITIARLKQLMALAEERPLTGAEREDLKATRILFDGVAAEFAPHERDRSSRAKFYGPSGVLLD